MDENLNNTTNLVYRALKELLEVDPEFDYRRKFVRFSTAPDAGALLYARQKLSVVADEIAERTVTDADNISVGGTSVE